MNATLARLHNFDPAAIGLGDYGRGENYVARQIERWSKQYRASETERIEEMERLIAWLPGAFAAATADAAGARRLPPRQHDSRAGRPESRRGARLGIVDARRSGGGFRVPPDAMGYAAIGSRDRIAGGTGLWRRSVSRPARPMSKLMSNARGSILARICQCIRPITSFASPPFCKASSAACATAPPPAHMRQHEPHWCGLWPPRRGNSPQAGA